MNGSWLVTGASGFLGYHVCRRLVEQGVIVRGIDIAPFDYPDLATQVEFLQGDIRDPDALEKVMQGVSVVVHAAAALPLCSREEIRSTNVGGTRAVLATAARLAVPRVVFISSTSVYGIPEHHPVDEAYPLVGVGSYGDSKIEAEAVCVAARQEGMCVPILRPKSFAGPKRLGVFQILCEWVQEGRNIPIVGKGRNRYQLLHVDDLVDAISLVASAPAEVADDVFNIGATQFGTMKDDLQVLLDYAGHGKSVVGIPSWLVIPALKVLERLHLSPLYEWIYETAEKDHYVSVEKAQRLLGWKPRWSTSDVWVETYKWYVDEGRSTPMETGVSHRVAWKQGILSFAKLFF
jgi:nucleoside-diphosphate-sugar epimerase